MSHSISSTLMFDEVESSTGAFRWLSPALIGLSAPIAFGLMLFPGAMEHARALLTVLLLAVLFLCVGAYGISVIQPGSVISMTIDREAREVAFVSSGMFASTTRALGFADIADVRVVKQYDDDGYAYEAGELRTREGEVVSLPVAMTAADVTVARRALGFGDTPQRRR